MEAALGIVATLLVCALVILVAHIRDDIAERVRAAERMARIETRLDIK